MNDTKSGVQRAIEAAWGKLPEIIIAVLVASYVFLGSLWLSDRDLRADIADIVAEQQSGRLCSRVGECPLCSRVSEGIAEVRQSYANLDARVSGYVADRAEWRERTRDLEGKVYELSTRAVSGADTRALEDRIRQLERKGP